MRPLLWNRPKIRWRQHQSTSRELRSVPWIAEPRLLQYSRPRPRRIRFGAPDRSVGTEVVDPDRALGPRLVHPAVQDEDEGPDLVEVEAAVRAGVDRAETGEGDGHALPFGCGAHGGKPPFRPLVRGGGVLVPDLHPDPVHAVAADREDEAAAAGQVARVAVDDGAEDGGLPGSLEAQPERDPGGPAPADPALRVEDRLVHRRSGIVAGMEDGAAVERVEGDRGRRRARVRRPGRGLRA